MAPRSSWKGFLKLSLVSVPVRAYSATSSSAAVPLHQLHAECHSRIKHRKVCPIHGEVSKDEIVSGYEYAKGQYVVIDSAELEKLRTDADRAITLDAVVSPETIDPIHFGSKSYYLLPDGAVGQKPFALIQECMAKDELAAIARVVLFGREEIMLVRPVDRVLAMTELKYTAEVTQPAAVAEELETPQLEREELALTRTLLRAFVRKSFSLEKYKDTYVERLTQLIEAKVEGKEVVAPPAAEEPQVINLMDALKRSVAEAQREEEGELPESGRANGRRRKMAPSRRTQSAGAKRKTG